ncbi:MAG: glycosyltransferase [Verrucomicrobia bacterium]|nr:glycosyltransferase [Verrucomicrobiota bacterium]
MILNLILGPLALLSLALTLWQWLVARRFPLHQRVATLLSLQDPRGNRRDEALTSPSRPSPLDPYPCPPVTLLKPLRGCDPATEDCLRSWFEQHYASPVQILFGVAAADDPVCGIVRELIQEFPASDTQLVVGTPVTGANAKVAKLVGLERLAKHDIIVISDADVRVPVDFLSNAVAPLCEDSQAPQATIAPSATPCGLVCCFYRLANPTTLAMQWEAVAINAEFWSQVLQSRSLKPIDFALGAVMVTRRRLLQQIGGFTALADCLADDYQLGNRLARQGYAIALSPVVVECWSAPMGWVAVWKHQLRWARTIRVCQPVPYFFSILSNATLWPLLWLALRPAPPILAFAASCWLVRMLTAFNLQQRLNQNPVPGGRASSLAQTSPQNKEREDALPPITQPPCQAPQPPTPAPWHFAWLPLVKDLLQAAIWLLAFMGKTIEWRGQRLRLRRDGTLVRKH